MNPLKTIRRFRDGIKGGNALVRTAEQLWTTKEMPEDNYAPYIISRQYLFDSWVKQELLPAHDRGEAYELGRDLALLSKSKKKGLTGEFAKKILDLYQPRSIDELTDCNTQEQANNALAYQSSDSKAISSDHPIFKYGYPVYTATRK